MVEGEALKIALLSEELRRRWAALLLDRQCGMVLEGKGHAGDMVAKGSYGAMGSTPSLLVNGIPIHPVTQATRPRSTLLPPPSLPPLLMSPLPSTSSTSLLLTPPPHPWPAASLLSPTWMLRQPPGLPASGVSPSATHCFHTPDRSASATSLWKKR